MLSTTVIVCSAELPEPATNRTAGCGASRFVPVRSVTHTLTSGSVVVLDDRIVIGPRFTPPVSNPTVSCCTPAPSVTGTLTVLHVCQPPVAESEPLPTPVRSR
jgi:hypothetical protein